MLLPFNDAVVEQVDFESGRIVIQRPREIVGGPG
jgi:ribosomal 30S subunit maturation factor RimM